MAPWSALVVTTLLLAVTVLHTWCESWKLWDDQDVVQADMWPDARATAIATTTITWVFPNDGPPALRGIASKVIRFTAWLHYAQATSNLWFSCSALCAVITLRFTSAATNFVFLNRRHCFIFQQSFHSRCPVTQVRFMRWNKDCVSA